MSKVREKLEMKARHLKEQKKYQEKMAKAIKAIDKKNTEIDSSKMNEAGFYEGMPGCFTDAAGNRRIFELALTPKMEVECRHGAHPLQVRECLIATMEGNAMTRQIFLTATAKFLKVHRRTLRQMKWKRRLWFFILFLTLGMVRVKAKDPISDEEPREKTSELSDEEYQKLVDGLEAEEDPAQDIDVKKALKIVEDEDDDIGPTKEQGS